MQAVIFENTYFVRATGPDVIALIDPITTQDLTAVKINQLAYTLFLNLKGRIIASTLVWKINETDFFFEVQDKEAGQTLINHISRYKLRSKCQLELVIKNRAVFTTDAVNDFAPSLWHDPRYDLYTTLLDLKASIKGTTQDKNALEIKRIRANRPDLCDLPVGFFPAETTAIELAVSMQKGCYLGQETVARMYYRGKTHRGRVSVVFNQIDTKLPVSITRADSIREVGLLTSVATVDNQQVIGMATLRTDALDKELSLPDGSSLFVNLLD